MNRSLIMIIPTHLPEEPKTTGTQSGYKPTFEKTKEGRRGGGW